jgi:uncharacterized protein YndB with AHSA1/START domain
MLKIILIALPVVIVVFLVIVALQPSDFSITRSATVAAPPEAVFPHVNDFHKWEAWSPWAKLDPTMKQTYEGAPVGTGARYSWTGDKKVGEGNMTITESKASTIIRIRLEFLRPFAAVNTTEFTFTPEGKQTTVTWSMTGTNNFMAKAFCLFMNMDRMVGRDFEKGLAQMKSVAEADAKK